MNKKLAVIGIGAVVGSMLLVSSVYAGVGSAPGYETFKSAFKNTAAVDNVTRQVNVTVRDNGTELLSVQSSIKTDRSEDAGSALISLKSGAVEQSVQLYHQDGQQIVSIPGSEVYQLIESGDKERKWKHRDKVELSGEAKAEAVAEVEHVVDALVGNLKNYVTVDPGPGDTQDIHIQLSGSQIPSVVNAIGSLLIKHAPDRDERMPASTETFGIDMASLKDVMPKLTKDIKIDDVELNATVDADNHITNQTAQFEIIGEDAQGQSHEVVISMEMSLSSFQTTVPDRVDVTGKQVKTVKPFRNFDE